MDGWMEWRGRRMEEGSENDADVVEGVASTAGADGVH
jgi:hypothetical protein